MILQFGQTVDVHHKILGLADMEFKKDVDIAWVKGHIKAENIKDVIQINNYRCDRMVHEARKAELIVDEGYKTK